MTTNTLVWLACGLAAAALVVFVAGRWGRRIDDHARCRRCAFDLSGHAPLRERCPECGRGLRGWRAVRIGRRRRRPWALVLSGVMLVLAVTCAIIPMRGLDPNAFKPSWLLLREAVGEDAALTTSALDELAMRLDDGSFADRGAVQTIVAETVRRLGDVQRPWEPRWAELTEAAILRGLVAPQDLEAYARAVVTELPKPEVVRAIRPGARAPFRSGRIQTRGPRTGSLLDVEMVWEDVLIDGRRGLLPDAYGYGQTVGADDIVPPWAAALNVGTTIKGLPAEPGTVNVALSGSLHVGVRVALPGPANVGLPPAETWAVFRAAQRRYETNALVRIPLHHDCDVRVVAVGQPLLPERETTARWQQVEGSLTVAQAAAGSGRILVALTGAGHTEGLPLALEGTLVHDGGRVELRGMVSGTFGGSFIGMADREIVGQTVLELQPNVRLWEQAPGIDAIPTRPIRIPISLKALDTFSPGRAAPVPAAPAPPRAAVPVERPLADVPVAELVEGFTGNTLTPQHIEFIRRLREEPPPTAADVALVFLPLVRDARSATSTDHPACAVLERLVRLKRLAPEHYAVLLDVILDAVEVRVRARVRGGASMPYLVEHGNLIPIRASGGPAFFVELLPRGAAAAAGAPAMRIDGYSRQVMGRSSIESPTALGPHRLTLEFDARLHRSYSARGGGEALAECPVVFTADCTIVEDSLAPMDVVADIDARVVVEFGADKEGEPWAEAHTRLRWDALPVDLCVTVEVILDGVPAGERTPLVLFADGASRLSRSVDVPPRADWPDTARVVLRPDPAAAEATMNTFEVLRRPIVLDDVPVHLVPKAR